MREKEMTRESEIQPEVTYAGMLEDFKLGNPESKIKSDFAEASVEARREYGEHMKDALTLVTDREHIGCIDGRCVSCNADGSAPEVRRRQVGGTGTVVETALNIGAHVLDTLPKHASIGAMVAVSEQHIADTLGIKRSAHLGTCGGVKGAVKHERAIAANPHVMAATEAVMNLEPVKRLTGFGFDADIAAEVARRSAKVADLMEASGWDEQKYVKGVQEQEAAGVEDLEGIHEEPAIVIIINTSNALYALSDDKLKDMAVKPPFVINLDLTKDLAEALGGDQGEGAVRQAFTHLVAKHMAVADDLPGPKTPLYILTV